MKAKILGFVAVGLLGSSFANASPIVLNIGTGSGTQEDFTILDVNLGATFAFDYQFSNFSAGSSYLQVSYNFIDPCCGPFGQVDSQTEIGGTVGPITTTSGPNRLAFYLRDYTGTRSATLTINAVRIDGIDILAPVPEPGSLALLGLGLLGLSLTRRRAA